MERELQGFTAQVEEFVKWMTFSCLLQKYDLSKRVAGFLNSKRYPL